MAAACPSCVFGATSTSLHSFTYHAVQTITVSVIPHVTVYTNGTEKTSFESITETNTDYVGGSNGTAPKTFSDKKDLTWTVGDATLTWPTTYVQYCGFEGATATAEGSSTCAQVTDAVAVGIPASAQSAPFIYPLEANATAATTLPSPLLDYLAQLPEVSEQFNGDPLTGCAPLTYPLSGLGYTTAMLSSSSSSSLPASSSALLSSSIPASSEMGSSSRPGNYSNPLTTRIRTTMPHAETSPIISASHNSGTRKGPHENTPGGGPPPSAPLPASSTLAYGSSAVPSPPAYTSPDGGTLTHSTAFVIEPITGPTTYTTISGPSADHTKKPANSPGKPPDNNQGDTQHNTGGNDGPSPGNSPHNTGGSPKPSDPPNHKPGRPGGEEPVSPADGGKGKPSKQNPAVYTNRHTSITAKSNGDVVIGSQTVRPGQKITIGSGSHKTEVALQTERGRTRLNIGGSVYNAVPQPARVTPAPGEKPVSVGVITTNGHEITAIRSGKSIVLVDGTSSKTIRAGEGATFEGQEISVPPRGGSIAVNGNNVALTSGEQLQATLTAGGHTFTAIDAGKSIVVKDRSSTIVLRDGEKTVFDGQTISAVSTGNAVVIDGKTTTLSAIKGAETSRSAVITAGGHTITALDKSGSVILEDGSTTATIRDGRTAVFEGQTFSVPRHGSAVVVNGKTTSFSSSEEPTTTGVGAYITGGLGRGGNSSPTSTAVLATTNAASMIRPVRFLSVFFFSILRFLGAIVVQ